MPGISSLKVSAASACLVAALALAACGSDDETTSTAAAPSSGGSAASVNLDDNADLGQILVDGSGRTLYLFEKDDEGDESYCDADCAKEWPPFTSTGQPQAGDGVDAAKLTTFQRDDGDTQVAYDDHPLYYYSGDQSPGDANGNGSDAFGAEWYALDAVGETVEGGESEDSGSDETSTDSGYGY